MTEERLKWYCKLGHPFEIGLYIVKYDGYKHLKCKGCDYDYTGIGLGKND